MYHQSAQAQYAPLSIVGFGGPWPDGLVLGTRPAVTPTFIVLKDRQEVGRIEGYSDRHSFFSQLNTLINAADTRKPMKARPQ